jgi:hypothetical protein
MKDGSEENRVGMGPSGRQAKTRGVSLTLREQSLVDEFQELTGYGFTEQVRQGVLAKLPAAIQLLRDMSEAGMAPGEFPPTQEIVYVETEDEREALYHDSYVGVEEDRHA